MRSGATIWNPIPIALIGRYCMILNEFVQAMACYGSKRIQFKQQILSVLMTIINVNMKLKRFNKLVLL